jgi:macrolide transport system ATP-binding/permease protein
MKPLIEIDGVSRQYGSDPAIHALVDVDLCMAPGEWLAITGPSGAGKSTLLHVLGCLDRPTSGRYFFDGTDTARLSDRRRAGLRSRRIGFVFQAFHLLPYRSVLENVMLAEVYRRQSYRGRRERALAAINKVGLRHRADFFPPKLSGGERQRVAIARALVGAPSVLLCDEPTGNLDSKATADLLDLFERLNQQGLALVIVTHNEDVAKWASRRVHILDGSLTEVTTRENSTTRVPQSHSTARWASVSTPSERESPRAGSRDERARARAPAPRVRAGAMSRSGITTRDLFDEAIAGMFARPGRMMLTVLGIVVGITALVATLGLTRTANNRIISQFDRLAATEIVVTPRPGPTGVDRQAIPWDAPARLRRLNGVVSAGTLSDVNVGDALVSSSPVQDPGSQTAFKLAVKAASPGLFTTVGADLESGRFPDLGHSNRADRVAVVGPTAARRLGIVGIQQLPAIAIGDHIYLVIGIMRDVARQPELLSSVLIPEGAARRNFGLEGPGSVIVETRIGAASLIAQQTPLALRPDNPSVLRLEVPPEPRRVRDDVQSDLNVMLLLLGGLSLVVGAIGIANITLVSVMERTSEIGLRRAIGATRGHIAAQFLLESGSMGVIGGLLGASLGVLIVVGVSAYQVWTPVLDPAAPLLAPLIGGVIGLVSGTYPALRAARLEPVEAFRN